MTQSTKHLYTTQEAATYCSLSIRIFLKLRSEGVISAAPIPQMKRGYMFHRDTLDRFLKSLVVEK